MVLPVGISFFYYYYHANLLCIVPILVYVLPKQAPVGISYWSLTKDVEPSNKIKFDSH